VPAHRPVQERVLRLAALVAAEVRPGESGRSAEGGRAGYRGPNFPDAGQPPARLAEPPAGRGRTEETRNGPGRAGTLPVSRLLRAAPTGTDTGLAASVVLAGAMASD
jgi:hypothetical protein